MQLGAFSISLAVKDIKKSKEFYEKLGFEKLDGNIEENWLILKNGDTVIGLFQEMFEKNTLTFSPGWDKNAKEVSDYTDVRELKKKIEETGIKVEGEIESDKGPGYFTITDPDGNPILIDQHV